MNDLDFINQTFPQIHLNYMLNGNNHTIKNVYINTPRSVLVTTYENVTDPDTGVISQNETNTYTQHTSLFIASQSSNYIKDIQFENITLSVEFIEEYDICAGLIFSEANTTLFENIKVQDSQIIVRSYQQHSYIGGIIGRSTGKTEMIYSDINVKITTLEGGENTIVGGVVGQQQGISNIFSNNITFSIFVENITQIVGGIIGQVKLVSTLTMNYVTTNSYFLNNTKIVYFGGILGSAENYQVQFNNIQNTLNIYNLINNSYQLINTTYQNFQNIGAIVGKKYSWCTYSNILTTWETSSNINVAGTTSLQRCDNCYLISSNIYNVITYYQCTSQVQFCSIGVQLLNIGIQQIENSTQCGYQTLGQQCAQYAHCQIKTIGQISSTICQCDSQYENTEIIYRLNQCMIKEVEETVEEDGTDYLDLLQQYQGMAKQNEALMYSAIVSGCLAFIIIIITIVYLTYIRKQNDKIIKLQKSFNQSQLSQINTSTLSLNKQNKQVPKPNQTFVVPQKKKQGDKSQQKESDQITFNKINEDVLSKTQQTDKQIKLQSLESKISTIDVF